MSRIAAIKMDYQDYLGLKRTPLFPFILSIILYTLWITFVVGFRPDHLIFIGFICSMYLIHPITRKLILSSIFFLLFWIIYDSMRIYPNYLLNEVHILQPYEIEKSIFGLNSEGSLLTPNEYFHQNPHPGLDLISGLFYLTWVPLPIAYGIYLFFKDRALLLKFSFAFLLTNLIGFLIYYSYPAAPPWYLIYHGSALEFDIPGNAANLTRFDALIGNPIFTNMYTKNANVFAAIPSLHAAYPIILFYFSLRRKYKWISILFFIDILGIWFAAVYSLHHYIIDLILGGFCALFAIFVFNLVEKHRLFDEFLNKYLRYSEA